jgi:hypothetical protein
MIFVLHRLNVNKNLNFNILLYASHKAHFDPLFNVSLSLKSVYFDIKKITKIKLI